MTVRFQQTDTTLAIIGQGKEHRETPNSGEYQKITTAFLKCIIFLRIRIVVRYTDEWVGAGDQWSRRTYRASVFFLTGLFLEAITRVIWKPGGHAQTILYKHEFTILGRTGQVFQFGFSG